MPKKTNHKYKKNGGSGAFRFIFKAVFIVAAFMIPVSVFLFFKALNSLPDPTAIYDANKIESTKIYDRTGKALLYDIHGEEKRTVVSSDKIGQHLKDATLAAEDDEFYIHKGIDVKAIIRALINDLLHPNNLQGGSTITQQLVKNSFLTPEKTITRKIKEALLSLKIEKTYTKDEILTLYLNQIPYGSNAYGIEAAAETFFNKKADDLSLAESSLLASLPKAPSYFSPYGSHKGALLARKDYILERMYKLNYITKEELDKAKNETLAFSQESKGIKAPHFVVYVKDYLEEKYGYNYIQKAGLKVYTTLDYDVQKLAEDSVSGIDEHLKKNGASNTAIVAIDPKTGQVLAMVGSKDYFDIKNEGNFNVTTAKRQPGSSFKPFAKWPALMPCFQITALEILSLQY
ncbi:penicillin-binding protein [Candidatus Azambacteria bacterium]|nr:penicillin-binding protein [Candidatus Azambacteria bacterium]